MVFLTREKKMYDLLCHRALDSSARPSQLHSFCFLNNTYIINLTGCAYLCSKYYKNNTKICHENEPKSAIWKKKMKRKKSSSNRMFGSNVLEETEEEKKILYFERSIFALLPCHKTQKILPPNDVFFGLTVNKMWLESVSGFLPKNWYIF